MLLELYIFFGLIAFLCFFVALYFNKGITNIFVWIVGIVLFAALYFASYNIEKGGVIYSEAAFSWFMLGMAVLSTLIFGWDLWDKFQTGDF